MRAVILCGLASALACAAPSVALTPRGSDLPVKNTADSGQLMSEHRCALNQTTRENCIAEGRNAAAEAGASYAVLHLQPATNRQKLRGGRGELAVLAYGGEDTPLPEWVREQHIYRPSEAGAEMCAVGVAHEPSMMAKDMLPMAQKHARAELVTFFLRALNEVPKGEDKPNISLAGELYGIRQIEDAMRRDSPGESVFALACLEVEGFAADDAAAPFAGDQERVSEALSRLRSKALAEAGVETAESTDPTAEGGEEGSETTDGAGEDAPEEEVELTKAQRKKAKKLSRNAARLLRARKYPKATKALTKCLEIDPAQCDCHRTFGIVLSRQGKAEEATPHYQAYLASCPDGKHAEELRMWVESTE